MTTGHVFIACSLDGYIARPDGALDWLLKHQTEGEDHGYDAFMASVDGLVMGRSSFETVLGSEEWSYGDKSVRVMSHTLTETSIPEALRGSVQLSSATPEVLMQQLDAEGWKRAYIDGGTLVQSFLRAGLI